ncbi:hypothetical protein N0V82_004538 [Gnomoniopsis sp. IMI 355080]|nr:hypothetical protein N0V82_004538 [Gnomoniopsis sp. IMI 355080]
MLSAFVITSIALAAAPALAIPPPIFGFPDSDNHTELTVQYTLNGNTTTVKEAMLFGFNITQQQPQLSLDSNLYSSVAAYNGSYTIIMVDPDASTPEDPSSRFILHWMAPNVTQAQSTGGLRQLSPPSAAGTGVQDFVSYRAPTPGNTSSAHRYIIYAFEQPATFAVPSEFASLAGGQNRTNFNLTTFMSAAGLDRPAAAEYFYVNRQTQVPGDFVALAGGTYPGGNGGAIFEDSPDAAGNATTTASGTSTSTSTSSSTASSTGATATDGSTASGAAGAAVVSLREMVSVGAVGAAVWGLVALL